MSWVALRLQGTVEVVPLAEKDHRLLGVCWCRPRVEMEDDYDVPIVTHRDLAERHGLDADSYHPV